MKHLIKTLAILIFIQIAFIGAANVSAQESSDKIKTMKCWASMDCEGCKAKIEKNIPFEKGVKGLEVDLATKTLSIKYRTDKTSPEKLEKAIQKLGFKTEVIVEKK